jgi:hypothetical protein
MKIIITESQNESLKNNLMKIINRSGFDAAIKTVGSFDRLVKMIGKETVYSILVKHGFDPVNKLKMVQSRFDVPIGFFNERFGYISVVGINTLLNRFGPMFLFMLNNKYYLYQDQYKENLFVGEYDGLISEEDFQNYILNPLGLKGLDIGKVIDLYYTEED